MCSIITFFNGETRLGGAWNMSLKMLKLNLMDVCLSKFSLINSGETLSLDIIRMDWLIATG